MASVADIWPRYRVAALALGISAALHAAVMVGIPGRGEIVEEAMAPAYSATLDPAAPAASVAPAPKAAAKPRRVAPGRPKSTTGPIVALSSAALDSALPAGEYAPDAPSARELTPPPEPPRPQPERLAMAQPATPIPALEAPKFPVAALPARLSVTYALTSPFADGRATYDWSP